MMSLIIIVILDLKILVLSQMLNLLLGILSKTSVL